MTIEEIEKSLPNGFHDAVLENFMLDIQSGVLKLSFNLLVEYNEQTDKTIYRRGEILAKSVSIFKISPYMAISQKKGGGTVFNVSNKFPDDSRGSSKQIKVDHVSNFYIGSDSSFVDLTVGYASAEFAWTDKDVNSF
ncbi:MAG: hypothetical protein AB7V08_04290 [Elusimicrobiales bacterium]